MSWRRHLWLLLSVSGGTLAVLWLFVVAMNPYGNLPSTVLPRHVIMDDNQRFQYPAIIRSRHFDSAVIGTSTARLISPAGLERVFGGRFANLALNDGTAWEQWQLARLFLREVERPRTLVVGLDVVWCRPEADRNRITRRGFPDWMYDANPWNDLAYLLNSRAVEISGRRLGAAFGLAKPRWPDDGFEIFTPSEQTYDLDRARAHIYENRPRAIPAALEPAYVPGPGEIEALRFPALVWLEELANSGFERGALVFTPVHRSQHPVPGSQGAAVEQECKRRISDIGRRAGWPVIDFRIASPITTDDANYWDPLHYRLAVARRIEDGVARAIATGRDDAAGDWRVLVPGRDTHP